MSLTIQKTTNCLAITETDANGVVTTHAIPIVAVSSVESQYFLRKGGGSAGGGQGGAANQFPYSYKIIIHKNNKTTFDFDISQVTNQSTWYTPGSGSPTQTGLANAVESIVGWL